EVLVSASHQLPFMASQRSTLTAQAARQTRRRHTTPLTLQYKVNVLIKKAIPVRSAARPVPLTPSSLRARRAELRSLGRFADDLLKHLDVLHETFSTAFSQPHQRLRTLATHRSGGRRVGTECCNMWVPTLLLHS